MAQLTTYKLLSILSLLITSVFANETDSELLCPTITKSTSRRDCPAPTPSFCPTPFCIIESLIPVPCGCPATLPTTTTTTACQSTCHEGCGTYFTPLVAACTELPPSYTLSTPTPTTTISITTSTITAQTQPTSCSTITISEGPDCWDAGCETTYSRCQKTKTVTLECGCKSIPTVTSCRRLCDGGCVTTWKTGYLPCPMSLTTTTPWGPPPTSVYGA